MLAYSQVCHRSYIIAAINSPQNVMMCMVTARHSQHIYSAIKIRKCRKGTSELENIVYMAYIWQLFPLPTFDHTLFEYCNNTSAFFLLMFCKAFPCKIWVVMDLITW